MKKTLLLILLLFFFSGCDNPKDQQARIELAITLDDLPLESTSPNTTPVAVSQNNWTNKLDASL